MLFDRSLTAAVNPRRRDPALGPPWTPKFLEDLLLKLLYIAELNFLTVHYGYFIFTILLSSVIFWGSSPPDSRIPYIDCLFMVTSAMTETGLNTVNLSILTTWQQIIWFMLIILGSYVSITIVVVLVRKNAFEKRFTHMVKLFKEENMEKRRIRRNTGFITRPRSIFGRNSEDLLGVRKRSDSSTIHRTQLRTHQAGDQNPAFMDARPTTNRIADQQVQTDGSMDEYFSRAETIELQEGRSSTAIRFQNLQRFSRAEDIKDASSFSPPIREVLDRAIMGRNGVMHILTQEDRDVLGGAEYRAVRLFCWVVPTYYIFWQVVGCLSTAIYIGQHNADVARENGQDPWWLGVFLAVSAFNNCGLSLLDLGMAPFNKNIYVLLTLALLILVGNVAYPIFLRMMLWVAYKLIPKTGRFESQATTLRFALDYPRRVYTSMFPSAHTWWLLLALVALTGIDWLGLTFLNLTNPVVQAIPLKYRSADDFFQSVSIRTVGFGVISISSLTMGNQVLLLIMMYISAYPFAIALRTSNVYEERSLGIYETTTSDPKELDATSTLPRGTAHETKPLYFMRTQISNQLSHDMWWLAIVVFAITCIEVGGFNADPKTYATFNILFEVVSAYGPVGLSTGLADKPYSLSGGFHVCSKLLIILVMIRGRHRGLPVAIDKAIMLPGEKANNLENERWKGEGGHVRRLSALDNSRR